MRTLLRDIQANVRSFVGGPFYHLMIVSCAAEDSAILLKGFEAVELSRELRYEPGERDNLERLLKVYSERGDSARLQQCERELAGLAS